MTETNTTRTPALSADDWRQIAVWLTAADIDGIEIGTPGHTLRMTRDGGSYQVQAMAVSDGASRSVPVKSIVVTAPCAGVLLDRHPLATEPWARSGDPVTAGDLIGLLQMGQWALQKHRGYLKADPTYKKRGRAAIIPFLL